MNKPPRPKGGRPKGSGKGAGKRTGPQQKRRNDVPQAADLVLDQGMSYEKAAEATDSTLQVVRASVAREEGRREGRNDPIIDLKALALSAQEKAEGWRRQEKRRMELEFQARVYAEVRRRIDEIILPEHKRQIKEAKLIYDRRRGIMDKATFRLIWSALHPDSRKSISDRRLAEAFDAFSALEKFLLNEKDSPTTMGSVPDNLAAWDKMRAARPARRKGASTVKAR